MASVESLTPETVAPPEVALLCQTNGCLAYRLRLASDGAPVLEWVAGHLGGVQPVPVLALGGEPLADGDGGIAAHLHALRLGERSELELAWPSLPGLRIRDVAHPLLDAGGRVAHIMGVVKQAAAAAVPLLMGLSGPDATLETTGFWSRRMVEHASVGLAGFDTRGRLAEVNSAILRLPEALVRCVRPGRSLRRILLDAACSGVIVTELAPRAFVGATLRTLREGRPGELRLADGRWFEWRVARFVGGGVAELHDVTDRERAEAALRAARDAAEDAASKKSRFLRAANHDLRQPLATLKILIYSSFGVQDDEKRLEFLHAMDVTVGIMDEILGSLLQIGQLDAGRIVPRIVHFQISQVISRLKVEFQPQAEAKGLRFRVFTGRSTVQSDRVLLERILSNFIANAIRYTETGGVLVGVRRRRGRLEVQVWDTGCGIAEDQRELIFEEFHQVAEQQRSRQRGLGLGLNIASRLAEILDHEISVRSWPGRGSVFSIALPFGDLWRSDLGEPEISERIGGEFLGVRMLVIEDNELLRNTVCTMLERWGVKVTSAGDGASTLALFRGEDPPDPQIVLVDYRLPNGRAGTDVLSDLKRLLARDLPGIVTTADNDPALINQIRSEGLPVLIKPVSPARLRSAMHHLLYEQNRVPEIT